MVIMQDTTDKRADRILEEMRTLFEQRGFHDVSKLLYAYRAECKECFRKEMDPHYDSE